MRDNFREGFEAKADDQDTLGKKTKHNAKAVKLKVVDIDESEVNADGEPGHSSTPPP